MSDDSKRDGKKTPEIKVTDAGGSGVNKKQTADIDENDLEEVGRMKYLQLKDELRARRLKVTGSKEELVNRLKDARRTNSNDGDDDDEDDDSYDDRFHDASNSSESEEDKERPVRRRRRGKMITFRDVEDSIQTFSGDNKLSVKLWIADFEEMATLCQWTDMQKIIYAKKLLRGSARLFVRFERIEKKWSKLKRALQKEFGEVINSHTVHKELEGRKKTTNETFHEYVYKMLEIAAQAKVENSAVIQYIIDGIQDDEVNKSILYSATTIRELKDKLTIYERMKMNTKRKDRPTGSKERRKTHENYNNTSTQRCYNCGEQNHLSAMCPEKQKGLKCFKCNGFGHIAAKCAAKETKNRSVSATQNMDGKYYKHVAVNNCEVIALIDTGSDLNLMRADQYVMMGAPPLGQTRINFKGIGSGNNSTLGEVCVAINVDGFIHEAQIHIVSDTLMSHKLLLGTRFLNAFDIYLEGKNISFVNLRDDENIVPEIFKIDITTAANDIDLSYLSDEIHRDELKKIIDGYVPRKSREVGIKMKLVLKDDEPVYQRARRLAPQEKIEVDNIIQTWLNDEVIQPSVSEYASPVVLVKKKDGSTRMCVDYRMLNRKIVKDRYPLPLIEDQVDALQGARIFSTIDLKNGFFHVPVDENSRKYTAFIVPNGHYEFLKTPFGLCNSPAIFQKFVNAVFRELMVNKTVLTYLDDVIVPAMTAKDGMNKLKLVLETASAYGLHINWSKCQFLKTKIEYLGYNIEGGEVKPSERKTTAVKKFPRPTNVKSVQSFLGLTGYFRKFIPRYSLIARPLTNLIRKDVKFKFGDEEINAFVELKQALSDRPVLKLYRAGAETELHTDACMFGYGAILMQRDGEDNLFHPVYYASGKTNSAEEKYPSYELEVLAIVKAIKRFRVYLLGITFKIVTDCQAFAMTMRKKELCVRVARWALALEEFDCIVEHRPGNRMVHADALSRNPLPQALIVKEDYDSIITRLRNAQLDDETVRKTINDEARLETDGYVVRNGLLYKIIDDDAVIVVPKILQTQIIKNVHDQGHFAINKTETLLKRDYWFKNMRAKVESVVRNCIECILSERKHGAQEGLLHNIEKRDVPLDTYHIDHLGPMTSTNKNYRHIFAVVDAFTKFVWLYPTKSTGTTEVVERLRKQSTIFGNPRRIVSDRGTAFTSNIFKEYCTNEKIQHVLITTGVPRGNGQVERINRILIPVITKLSLPKPEEWYKYVDKAQQYINATPSRSTGVPPFQLLIGVRMNIQDDLHLKETVEKEWIELFQTDRDDVRQKAKEKIGIMQTENKKRYDKRRKKATKYEEDALVAIKRTQFSPGLKFHAKFLGPYKIKKILRHDRYVVEKVGEHEGPRNTTTSADNMKQWATTTEVVSNSDESDASDE